MSRARGEILARVRAALTDLPGRRALPEYPDGVAVARDTTDEPDRVARFRAKLASAGGRAFTDAGALAAWLFAAGATRGICDPALVPALAPAFGPAFTLGTALDRARIDDYDFGVTRAQGGIAETGSLILTDAGTSTRLSALAPWIHIAVLDPSAILEHVHDAIAALGDDPNVIWCTGPSRTADVEGILIDGVHGPGEQVALILSA